MTPAAFRDALQELEISPNRFAQIIGIDEPTVQGWASGELPIPRLVELFLVLVAYEPGSFHELVKAQELLDDEL
jgi:DNA-binding transcriptional regulator YiaG